MISERSLLLHYLRFLSAVIVCLGHCKEFLFVHMDESASLLERVSRLFLGLGSSAVLVFFFLSGYLVGGKEISNLKDNKLDFKNYLFNRLTRLLIVLLPALLATFAMNAITCGNSRVSLYCLANSELASHSDVLPQSSQKISDLIYNVLFLQPFMGTQWGGNVPLWSLSYEFWYYVIFFSILNIFGEILYRKVTLKIVLHLLIISVASRFLDWDWLLLGIIWLSGALTRQALRLNIIVIKFQNFQKIFRYKFILITFFLVFPILIFLRILPKVMSFPVSIFLLILVISITSDEFASSMNKMVQKLIIVGSEFSFSLYLTHFPFIALTVSFISPVERWKMSPIGIVVMFGLTFAAILMAYFFASITEFKLAKCRSFLKIYVKDFFK